MRVAIAIWVVSLFVAFTSANPIPRDDERQPLQIRAVEKSKHAVRGAGGSTIQHDAEVNFWDPEDEPEVEDEPPVQDLPLDVPTAKSKLFDGLEGQGYLRWNERALSYLIGVGIQRSIEAGPENVEEAKKALDSWTKNVDRIAGDDESKSQGLAVRFREGYNALSQEPLQRDAILTQRRLEWLQQSFLPIVRSRRGARSIHLA
ncbi:hypothetical protein FRB99_007880 [Tulasnella sp. 403]|nr:hypothetical protein FRB99_007880 [Tulasnella sp. 403]